MTTVAWVALGSNLGDRRAQLARLRAELEARGPRIDAASIELVTRPVGVVRQRDFRNQVVRLRATGALAPPAWLAVCQDAERASGRRPTYRWGPRRADADILLLGARGEIRAEGPGLRVPHPRLRERPFFCALAASLDPTLEHPDGWPLAAGAGTFARLVHWHG